MNIRSIISYGAGVWTVAVGAAALLFTGCQKDELAGGMPDRDKMNFHVSVTDEWVNVASADSTGAGSRAAGGAEGTAAEASAPAVRAFSMDGAPGVDSLFLHTSVLDRIEAATLGSGKVTTRGTPIHDAEGFSKNYGSFGAFAYMADLWNANGMPVYFSNLRVTQEGNYWVPDVDYHWLTCKHYIRAYAPYDCKGLTMPEDNELSFHYQVPQKAEDQQDLLMAYPTQLKGEPEGGSLALDFKHVLTAVRFVADEGMRAGSIESIRLKGVYVKAEYQMSSYKGSWLRKTTDKNVVFSHEFTPKQEIDGTPDKEITPDEATFMMLPQTLSTGATIEIVFNDKRGGGTYTLTADISGQTWEEGKTVVYRISNSSLSDYYFLFAEDQTGIWNDGDGNGIQLHIGSSVSVKWDKNGTYTEEQPLPVTIECVKETSPGSGEYEVITAPEWITVPTGKFTPNVEGKTVFLKVTNNDQNMKEDVSHKEALQNKNAGNDVDLSKNYAETANCYVVDGHGSFKLPLVYGNGVKNRQPNADAYKNAVDHNGNTITNPFISSSYKASDLKAEIVWQDKQNLVTNVKLEEKTASSDFSSYLNGNKELFLTFDIDQNNIDEGNAVLCVKTKMGAVVWSWHIWVTDYNLNDVKTVNGYDFLPVNVGQKHGSRTYAEDRSVKLRITQYDNVTDQPTGQSKIVRITQEGKTKRYTDTSPYYQFGRKDPLPGFTGRILSNQTPNISSSMNCSWYDNSGKEKTSIDLASIASGGNTLVTGIKNPGKLINNWGQVSANDLHHAWSNYGKKTVYDPCPPGYMLPSDNLMKTSFIENGEPADAEYDRHNAVFTLLADEVGIDFTEHFFMNSSGKVSSYALNSQSVNVWTYNITGSQATYLWLYKNISSGNMNLVTITGGIKTDANLEWGRNIRPVKIKQ